MLTAVLVAAAAGACSTDDGRAIEDPAPGATAPLRSISTNPPAVTDPVPSVTAEFALSTESFAEGAGIPARYSCGGPSPPLRWSGVPEGTVELALVVVDRDAAGFVHWAIWGIDPATTGLAEGEVPAGARQARGDAGDAGWSGPCPPEGAPHTYVFTLHSLSAPLDLSDGADGDEAQSAINAATAAQAQLTATYASS